MENEWLVNLRAKRIPESIGDKAKNLRRLAEAGFRVPITHVCIWEAYEHYLAHRLAFEDELKKELALKTRPEALYAVRSSANLEDGKVFTFAGQFNSHLNVQGIDPILRRIQDIWAMTCSDGVKAYLQKHGLDGQELKMAVLVQEMVSPVVSGVSFSRNPVNGAAEVVVEALPGTGEALMQAGQTPLRWVWRANSWQTKPSGSPIDLSVVDQVVRQTQAIARRFRMDVDLEWVFDGSQVYWVQMREITAPRGIKIYSRRIAKDMLPGMIHPLVWSVNISIVNGAWIELLTELIGPNDFRPDELARSFFYRAYFEMGVFRRIFQAFGFPEESLEMMMGVVDGPRKMPAFKMSRQSLRLMPRLIRFVGQKSRFSSRVQQDLPELRKQLDAFAGRDLAQMDEPALLAVVDQLSGLVRQIAYYNINVPLLMSLYNQVLRRQLRSSGIDFEQVDIIRGFDEIKKYEPGAHLKKLHQSFMALPEEKRQRLQAGGWAALQEMEGVADFKAEMDCFVASFGHLSDSGNDFSCPPWREQPDLILEMLANLAETDGGNGSKGLGFEELRLPWLKKRMLAGFFNRARQFRFFRDQVGSLYTLAYGQFRNYFLALGRRLVQRGILAESEAIFLLSLDEVRQLVQGTLDGAAVSALVVQRRAEMEQVRDLALPETIYGEETQPIHLPTSRSLAGIPTSRGLHTGPVVVVRGLRDFSKMRPGMVLVIPFSDVGWTPLFFKAGAVISESGGLLSHSSIIARECGIPAVVSVEGAMNLADQMRVTVNGYTGEILVHSEV